MARTTITITLNKAQAARLALVAQQSGWTPYAIAKAGFFRELEILEAQQSGKAS